MLSIARILVPVDFSPCSRAALSYATSLARSLDAEVEVLHVWEPPPHVSADAVVAGKPGEPSRTLAEFARTAAARDMDIVLESVERAGVSVHARLETGPVVETIVDAARDAQLVVMGTHGRTGLAHVLLGSVAERVVRQAACPVLTLRETAQSLRSAGA